jgi:hypothetical protein
MYFLFYGKVYFNVKFLKLIGAIDEVDEGVAVDGEDDVDVRIGDVTSYVAEVSISLLVSY